MTEIIPDDPAKIARSKAVNSMMDVIFQINPTASQNPEVKLKIEAAINDIIIAAMRQWHELSKPE